MTTLTPAAMLTAMHEHTIVDSTVTDELRVETCRCGVAFTTSLVTSYYETRPGTPSLPGIHAADQLALAQGYIPSMVGQATLDTLPLGTIIKDANGTLFQKYRNIYYRDDLRWVAQTGIHMPEPVVIPATILWTPQD